MSEIPGEQSSELPSAISNETEMKSPSADRVESPDHRLRVKWSLEPANFVRLYDTVVLTLDVTHSLDLELVPLEFGDTLGDMRVVEVVPTIARIAEQRETHRIVVHLTPETAGRVQIGAIPVRCKERMTEAPPNSDVFVSVVMSPYEMEIQTPVAISVASQPLHQGSGPLSIPDYGLYYWVFGILLLLALGVFVRRKRRSKMVVTAMTERTTPTQIAMRRLANLLDQRLHERDVKRFYVEITSIVRWFIEQKTEIHAPELTTEEFLREFSQQAQKKTAPPRKKTQTTSHTASSTKTGTSRLITLETATGRFKMRQAGQASPEKDEDEFYDHSEDSTVETKTSAKQETSGFFSETNRAALAEFLEIADLVKFAKFEPTREEVLHGFRRASEFVELGSRLETSEKEISIENTGSLKPQTVTLRENAQTGTHRFTVKESDTR